MTMIDYAGMTMIDYAGMSINSRIALCLAFAEKATPYLEGAANRDAGAARYGWAAEEYRRILGLAWDCLPMREAKWAELYRMCNDEEGEGGFFELVSNMNRNGNPDPDETAVSNAILYSLYYTIYQYAKRQGERYLPQDLWDGSMGKDDEAAVFSSIAGAVGLLITDDEKTGLDKVIVYLQSKYPFKEDDPFGRQIRRDELIGI
ncbi:MAG: hypothetical protein FWG03_09450 [Clostridiales bacterium]|nr:hypothetical protein [Clostridiales bacterium]